MGLGLRLLLIAGALMTMLYFLYQIRKNRLQIDYTISWTLFCGFVLLLSLFPGAVTRVSSLLGFESPSNLVYLGVIFILVVKLFTTTIKLSKMNRQIADLAQYIAIEQREKDERAHLSDIT